MKKLILSLMLVGALWSDSTDEKMKIIMSVDLSKINKLHLSPNHYNRMSSSWLLPPSVSNDDPSESLYYSPVFLFYTGKIKYKNEKLKIALITTYINEDMKGSKECANNAGGELDDDSKFQWERIFGHSSNNYQSDSKYTERGLSMVYAPKYKTGFIERAICLPTGMVKDLIIDSSRFSGDTIDQKSFFERFGKYGLKTEITFEEIEKNINHFYVFPIEKFPINEE